MDYEKALATFLACKNLTEKSRRTQKSQLGDFLVWRSRNPGTDIEEESFRYCDYLQSDGRGAPSTIYRKTLLVREFTDYVTHKNGFYDPGESLPERRGVPCLNEGLEFSRICTLQMRRGWVGYRDSALALVAYSCSLSCEQLSKLVVGDCSLGLTSVIRLSGSRMELPGLACQALSLFFRGRKEARFSDPMFPCSMSQPWKKMRPCDIRRSLEGFAKSGGLVFEDLFEKTPEQTIRERLDHASPYALRNAASVLLNDCFGNGALGARLISRSESNLAWKIWEETGVNS